MRECVHVGGWMGGWEGGSEREGAGGGGPLGKYVRLRAWKTAAGVSALLGWGRGWGLVYSYILGGVKQGPVIYYLCCHLW